MECINKVSPSNPQSSSAVDLFFQTTLVSTLLKAV